MVKHEIKVIDVIEDKPPEINNEQIDEEPTKEEPTKEEPAKEEESTAKPIKEKKPRATVSYTHLTLPTIYSV